MARQVNWLLDTNILIDYLQGHAEAQAVISAPEAGSISIMTWMEVLVAARSEAEEHDLRHWMQRFGILPVDDAVALGAVRLRRQQTRLRLPDALIRASATVHSLILVTRNTRDFSEGEPGIHCPYRK